MNKTERMFLETCRHSAEAYPEYIQHNPAPELVIPGAARVSHEIRAKGREIFSEANARSKVEESF